MTTQRQPTRSHTGGHEAMAMPIKAAALKHEPDATKPANRLPHVPPARVKLCPNEETTSSRRQIRRNDGSPLFLTHQPRLVRSGMPAPRYPRHDPSPSVDASSERYHRAAIDRGFWKQETFHKGKTSFCRVVSPKRHQRWQRPVCLADPYNLLSLFATGVGQAAPHGFRRLG